MGNFPDTPAFGKYYKYSTIRFQQEFGKLRNFLNTQTLKNFQNLKNKPPSNSYSNLGNLGNSSNTWEPGKFPKYLGIWEILQIPGNLGNFLNSWESEGGLFFNFRKFLKCRAIWEISQIPRYLGNSPSIQSFEKFPKF